MDLLTLGLIVVVVGLGLVFYFNRSSKSLDVNDDGKVNAEDVKVAVENTVAGVKEAADVNDDGKVNAEDVKVAAKKTKAAAMKATTKAKEKVKTATAKKPGRKPKTAAKS